MDTSESLTVQQTHPFGSSIRFVREDPSVPSLAIIVSTESVVDKFLFCADGESCDDISPPNSFSMTAIRRLCCLDVSMFLRRVVLPEPRKPVRIVTGTGEPMASTSNRVGISSSLSEFDICKVSCGWLRAAERLLPLAKN